MVADRHRHAAYHTSTDEELLTNVNIDNLEWPWTLKILISRDFWAIFGCKRVNYDEMDGDRLRLPANRNCYRLSRVSWALLKFLVIDLQSSEVVSNSLHRLDVDNRPNCHARFLLTDPPCVLSSRHTSAYAPNTLRKKLKTDRLKRLTVVQNWTVKVCL